MSHNRDEDVARKTYETLITKEIDGVEATFPVDLLSNGTWILTSKKWSTAILNGAEHFHYRNPPYKHSRGLFPFELMKFNDAYSFIDSLNLKNIEPFTQIIIDNLSLEAWDFRWDGKQKNLKQIMGKLFITSSSTLYSNNEKLHHQHVIREIEEINPANLAQAHNSLQWKYKSALPMIKTTSFTQILLNSKNKSMKFMNTIIK